MAGWPHGGDGEGACCPMHGLQVHLGLGTRARMSTRPRALGAAAAAGTGADADAATPTPPQAPGKRDDQGKEGEVDDNKFDEFMGNDAGGGARACARDPRALAEPGMLLLQPQPCMHHLVFSRHGVCAPRAAQARLPGACTMRMTARRTTSGMLWTHTWTSGGGWVRRRRVCRAVQPWHCTQGARGTREEGPWCAVPCRVCVLPVLMLVCHASARGMSTSTGSTHTRRGMAHYHFAWHVRLLHATAPAPPQ